MTSKIEKFKEEVYKQCIEHEDYDMRISYILSKKEDNDIKSHKAICYSYSDPDQIRTVTEQDNTISYSTTLEWAFNFDEDFLSDLQDNWKIEYMPIEEHYNVWCAVNELRDEIYHTDGLQEYLKYCQKNQIDSNTISLLGLRKVNIMDMYIEKMKSIELFLIHQLGKILSYLVIVLKHLVLMLHGLLRRLENMDIIKDTTFQATKMLLRTIKIDVKIF